jgi:hypothetical protein
LVFFVKCNLYEDSDHTISVIFTLIIGTYPNLKDGRNSIILCAFGRVLGMELRACAYYSDNWGASKYIWNKNNGEVRISGLSPREPTAHKTF